MLLMSDSALGQTYFQFCSLETRWHAVRMRPFDKCWLLWVIGEKQIHRTIYSALPASWHFISEMVAVLSLCCWNNRRAVTV